MADEARKDRGGYIREKSSNETEISVSTEKQSLEVRNGLFQRFVDSFKRAEDDDDGEINLDVLESCDERRARMHHHDAADVVLSNVTSNPNHSGPVIASSKLKSTIQPRHTVMMSLGTGIGTGLLVANGKSLYFGGPGGLLIGYVLVSIVSYIMMQAVGELALAYPKLPGNFNAYQAIFISPAWGFATVYLSLLQWLTVLPLELITGTLIVQYWNDKINPDVFVVIFFVFLLGIHYWGSGRCYAEFEFVFNTCKVLMIIGFVILGIIINCGGAGKDGYIGGEYWKKPGSFAEGSAGSQFKGVCYTLITGFFSYGGQELFALTVNESVNPRKAIPSATKKSIYRILFIYLLTMIIIGFLVPRDSDELMGAGGSATHASPYVIAISSHGVKIVPHIVNAVILISIISVGNTALYSAPRLLNSLAEQNMAPKILNYVDRRGRPLVALVICSVFGVIAFAAASKNEEQVFTWLAAIAGLAELYTWTGICLSHYRFRRACKVQNRPIDDLGYVSTTGEWGSLYAVFFNILVFIAQFWVALFPMNNKGKADAEAFFESYLAAPIWIVLYFGYMLYSRDFTFLVPLKEIDLDSYRKRYDPEILRQEDLEHKEKVRSKGWWYKLYDIWC